MEKVSLENFVEQKEVDLYPITLMKYLLNKKRNLTFFAKKARLNTGADMPHL